MFENDNNYTMSPLMADLYELTMAQGYFHNNKANQQACFYMFFRDYPFKGGYAIACGVEQIVEYIKNFKFNNNDIEYLKTIKNNDGTQKFSNDFLSYLKNLELCVDIDIVDEGTVVFPYEPVVRVCGPMLECQLLETAILNAFNFQTLIATKAARIVNAAGCPVAEFGARRAQGNAGAVWASRASIIGGCKSTSNVEAGMMFDVPVSGTHAHSWVMAFDNELEAFRAYAKEFPENCVLLVDTYDVIDGIKNAIIVGHEMKERGQKLSGIRIDSGDLTWISKTARKMLDDAGLNDCGIVLSNDLDEYSITSIKSEGGVFTSLGVGTKLVTAYDQPALGGVYKLCATKDHTTGKWLPHMKISESSQKTTIPGVLNVKRFKDDNGKLAGDMIFDESSDTECKTYIVDPMDNLRRKNLDNYKSDLLLKPLFRQGKFVGKKTDVMECQKNAIIGLDSLDETQKRILNPHTYPVGLEASLNERRIKIVAEMRGLK